MNDLERLKKLAGIGEKPANENLDSPISGEQSQQKRDYEREHGIRVGSDEWFKLWFARPGLTGENPMPKDNK